MVLICILILIIVLISTKELILKKIYKTKYEEYVEKYAKEYNVDKYLIYSIIKAESNFKENSVSASGAIGLMQLMEKTAYEVASKIGYDDISIDDLYNPEINIRLGTYYFSELLKKYNGAVELAIIAYNAGSGNVGMWINNQIIKEDGSDIENVPYKETNIYVRKILRDYGIYNRLYICKIY